MLHHFYTRLFFKYGRHGNIPETWKHSSLIAIPKSKLPMGPNNCRGISLLNLAPKVLTRIILNRHPQLPISTAQLAFTKARSTVHAIHIAQQTIHHHRLANCTLFMGLVDVSKAFDNVRRELIAPALFRYGFPQREISLISELYDDSASLTFNGIPFGPDIRPCKGVKQGCIISPTIFIILLDLALRETMATCAGIRAPNGSQQLIIAYADDVMLFCNSHLELQTALQTLENNLHKLGLNINPAKSEILHFPMRHTSDSKTGYESRVNKLGCIGDGSETRLERDWPLLRFKLIFQKNQPHLKCPTIELNGARCPYTTSGDTKTPPAALLQAHLLSRHNIPTRRVGWINRPPPSLKAHINVPRRQLQNP